MKPGRLLLPRARSSGFGWPSTAALVRLSACMSETGVDKVRRHSGVLYPLCIGSVRFAIATFGRPIERSYPVNDIELWAKRVDRPIGSNGSTARYSNGFPGWCERLYPFRKSWRITLVLSGTSSTTTTHPYPFSTTLMTILHRQLPVLKES